MDVPPIAKKKGITKSAKPSPSHYTRQGEREKKKRKRKSKGIR